MDTADILEPNIDKTQLPPLHQKRILAFVNHFLISSCRFLNDFALQCETRFIDLERRLQKVEAALTIIESKLDSIPDVKIEPVQTEKVKQEELQQPKSSDEAESSLKNIEGIKVSEHDSYKKFFRMLQVGVPSQAVKIKMQVEGLDSNMLDDPNLVIPLGDELNACQES